MNPLNSPWFLDDITQIVTNAGHQLDVIMLPKVEGPWDIHFADQLSPSWRQRRGLTQPILFHAILETAQGMALVEAIALASSAHAGHEPRPRRSGRLAR
jgi:malyl-CoA/(S)-citramalyl-CoA lyase